MAPASDDFDLASIDETSAPPASPTEIAQPTASSSTSVGSDEPIADGGLFSADATPVHDLSAAASTSVFDVIAALPSYTIPRRTLRSPIDRLTQMAILLAGEHDGVTIDAKAPIKARAALLSVIDERRQVLEESGELDELVRGAGVTRLFERTVGFANPTSVSTDTSSELVLDARGVQILMKRAEVLLPQGLANAYVKRLAERDDQIRQAQLTTIALAGDPGCGRHR